MLTTEGMIITSATTAPFPKLGTLPSISVYSTLAITSNCPPTEAGMPKSVKHRKKVCIKDAARVPSRGVRMVIRNVCSGESPISLDTIINRLSIYPMAL